MTNEVRTPTQPPAVVLFSLLHHSDTTIPVTQDVPIVVGLSEGNDTDTNIGGYIAHDDAQSLERMRLAELAASALTDSIYAARSARLFDCGRRKHVNGRSVRFVCGSQGCPFCYGKRLSRIKTPLAKQVASLQLDPACHLIYVTISLQDVEDAQLGEAFDVLKKGFHRLLRRKPFIDALGAVVAKEFTVRNNETLTPHAHVVLLFSSKEQADLAHSNMQSYFAKAAQLDYPPYFYWEPIVSADDIGRRKATEYAVKLPDVKEFQALLDHDPTRFLTVYSAINGPRPGGTRTQLVSKYGVFKTQKKVTAKKLMAMRNASEATN